MAYRIGDMDPLFRDHILDHYKNPRCHGTLERPDARVEDMNPLCGDRLRMDFRFAQGRVVDSIGRWGGHNQSFLRSQRAQITPRKVPRRCMHTGLRVANYLLSSSIALNSQLFIGTFVP